MTRKFWSHKRIFFSLICILSTFLTRIGECKEGGKTIGGGTNPFAFYEDWKDPYFTSPIDVNNDGEDEFVRWFGDWLELTDASHFVYWRKAVKTGMGVSPFFKDFNQDGSLEIFATWWKNPDGSRQSLWVFDTSGNFIRSYRTLTNDHNKDGLWDQVTYFLGLLDANGDGSLDIVTAITSGYDEQPRGIVVYNHFSTDTLSIDTLWTFRMGGMPYRGQVRDINGDGSPEILLSTWAPCNGVEENGIDDCNAYLIVLDRRGNLLWARHLASYYNSKSEFVIEDIDRDGQVEIIAIGESNNPNQTVDTLFVLDGKSGEIKKKREVGERLRGIVVADLNGNGSHEILCGNDDGYLRILDDNLNTIDSAWVSTPIGKGKEPIEVRVLMSTNLTDENKPEILVGTQDRRLLLLDFRLKDLAFLENIRTEANLYPTGLNLHEVHSKKGKKLLIVTYPEGSRIVVPIKLPKTAFWETTSGIAILLLVLTCGVLVFAVIRLGVRFGKVSTEYGKISTEYEFHNRRMKLWLETTQAGFHHIKNIVGITKFSISEILESHPKIKDATQQLDHIVKISEDLRAIYDIREFHLQDVDVNSLLTEVIGKLKSAFPAGIVLHPELATDLPKAKVDKNQMDLALSNLINNAIQAMDSKGILTVVTMRDQRLDEKNGKNTYVKIEIRDTGKGIPEEDLGKVFQTFYTTKKGGTGLGLPIAKKIIDDHRGEIQIASQRNLGTIVTVRIPAS